MAKINSKKKGNGFERDVVNAFKELFQDEGFVRNWSSGSIFGGKNRSRIKGVDENFSDKVLGDIIVPEKFPFTIECKAYKDLDFHNIINGKCSKLTEWIEQAEFDAEQAKTDFILIIKINNKGKYVCTKNFAIGRERELLLEPNITRYMSQYYVYSYELFEAIANDIILIQKWKSINKEKGEV